MSGKKLVALLAVLMFAGCAAEQQKYPVTISWKAAPAGAVKWSAMPDIEYKAGEDTTADVQVVIDTDVIKPTKRVPGITDMPGRLVNGEPGTPTCEIDALANEAKPDLALARTRCMQKVTVAGSGEIKGSVFQESVMLFLAFHDEPRMTELFFPKGVTTPTFRVALFKARGHKVKGVPRDPDVQLSNWLTIQVEPKP